MKKVSSTNFRIPVFIFTLLLASSDAIAQVSKVYVPDKIEADPVDQTWTYVVIFGLMAVLAGAIYWKYKGSTNISVQSGSSYAQNQNKNTWEREALDADKEMEWLRKNKKVVGKKDPRKNAKLPRTREVLEKKAPVEAMDEEVFQQKMQKFQFSQLPVNSFTEIKPSKPYDLLPLSNDPSLMSAIEQVHDEFEEDEEVRDLAVRILAAFRTRNSAEALFQTALYDLSSSLRSKAVSILTDFDHEAVFEALLLACADPTREVRAAAARGIFRLSFDRADAWTRIMETGDEFRMRHAARAATEAGLVERSIDRLVHEDIKIAYEAFTLVALLLKTGETAQVFEALTGHADPNVQKALMQVFKITKEPNALDGLYALLETSDLPEELRQEADALVAEIGLVAA